MGLGRCDLHGHAFVGQRQLLCSLHPLRVPPSYGIILVYITMCVCVHIYIYIYMCVCVNSILNMYVYIYIYIYVYIYINCMYFYIIYTHTSLYRSLSGQFSVVRRCDRVLTGVS